MVILKKIKASTLMESMVATIIIVIIFMLSTTILNNMFINVTKNEYNILNSRLNEVEYHILHNKLKLPYNEDFNDWTISVKVIEDHIKINAKHLKTAKEINRHLEK